MSAQVTSLLLLAALVVLVAGIDLKTARPRLQTVRPVRGNIKLPYDSRIVGGAPASRGQLPYQVAIYMTMAAGTFFCGGSLISRSYVLTAAHCTRDATAFEVILGAVNPQNTSDPDRVSVKVDGSAAIEHPDYNINNKLNDIALLRLPQAVKLTDAIQTIRLPSRTQAQNNHTFENATVTISGWGKVTDDNPYISSVLNHAEAPVIGNPLCTLYFLTALYGISHTQVCTGGSRGTNTCSGDSGGPVVVLEEDGVPTEIGLVSIGFNKCERGWPSAHTRLTSFLDFIENNSDVKIRS
ncbi:brachyurin [Anabrus simplex]|uniref:brachyurin n=1 Tax=Anabrus simplex TaxID=316456 RepID=UPI0035A2755E